MLIKERQRYGVTATEALFETGEIPPTPKGFTVCTPQEITVSTPQGITVCTPRFESASLSLLDNFPSLMLFRQLRPYVYGSTIVPSDPSSQHAELYNNDVEEIGTELAAVLTQGPSWLSSPTGTDDDLNLDIIAESRISNVGSHSALSSVLRTDKMSHILLSLLYSVTNNLFSESQASEVYQVISRGINRKFFKALIANVSPVTQTIARVFLPAAIESVDASIVKALLATGVDPNFDMWPYQRWGLFLTAIRSGNVEIVQHFLDHGAHVNVSSNNSIYTPLEEATATGRLDLVRLMLQAGAEMNDAERYRGSSALCLAASYGTLELVQLLVDAGADVRGSMRRDINEMYRRTRPTVLSFAVERGDIAMTEFLISCGADVNVLGDAVSMEMLQLLLSHGANNVLEAMTCANHYPRRKQAVRFLVRLEFDTHGTLQDSYGIAALGAATYCNDVELVTWLLDFGIGVSITPAILSNPLHTAVQWGYLSLAQLLIAHGADINAGPVDSGEQSLLQIAVLGRHRHLVEFLLRSGADVNAPKEMAGRTAIATAICLRETEVVQLLLASGADMDAHGPSAVLEAIHVGSPELLRIVLDAWMLKGDIEMGQITGRRSETPLSLAARHANVELIQLLFDYNVCKAEDVSYALARVAEHGNLEVVRLLLASGAHVGYEQDECYWASDSEGNYYRFPTALDKAAKSGNMDILNLLLQHPTTVEERNQALQVAAIYNQLDAVMSLLDHGAQVNAAPFPSTEHPSRTALQAAAATGDLKLVRRLLDAGATVESIVPSAREACTALQLAAISGSINVAVAPIQRGADVNAPSLIYYGKTAMEGAAENGRLDMVQLLINAGAGRTGSDAVEYARSEGHGNVVALLLENGFEGSKSVWSDGYLTTDEVEDDTMG